MKHIAILILSFLAVFQAFGETMPDDVKTQLEAKAKELNPDNEEARTSWLNKQKNAWESLQYLTFSIPAETFEAVKKSAAEKFPFEFSAQEKFITEQINAFVALDGYKLNAISDADFAKLKEAAIKLAGNDYVKAGEIIVKQSEAKLTYDAAPAPAGMDAITFEITKKVLAEKFPGDYIAQLEALGKMGAAANSHAATGTATAASGGAAGTQAAAAQTNPRDKDPAQFLANATTEFSSCVVLVEDATRPILGLYVTIQEKPAIILPFEAYKPEGVTVKNISGDYIELKRFLASKDAPVVVGLIDGAVPASMQPAEIVATEKYKDILQKNIAFLTARNGNPFAFAIKVSALSPKALTPTAKIPISYPIGSIITDTRGTRILAMTIETSDPVKLSIWPNYDACRTFLRTLQRDAKTLVPYRLDSLKNWETLDPEKYKVEKAATDNIKSLNLQVLTTLTAARYEVINDLPLMLPILEKHKESFRQKTEKARYERFAKAYLSDILNTVKFEIKNVDPKEYYTAEKDEALWQLEISRNITENIDKAVKTNNAIMWLPQEAKRTQSFLQ